jgi:tetratricopeptide (TPR) repeat protein
LVLASVLFAGGCAARAAMPPAPAVPRYPDFAYPSVPPTADESQQLRVERGWRYLQMDNTRNAAREFEAALRAQPTFYPAATGLGYVELARDDHEGAVNLFDKALALEATYAPALVGRGQALLSLGRDNEALASFEAALAADPSLTEVERRISVLRFRALQENLARAQTATQAGQWDAARAAYARAIAASPESAFLYRELGLVERKAGQTAAALENLRKALALDASDAAAHAALGALLEEQGDFAGALAAYEKARALDPGSINAENIERVREAEALARLPAPYRAIPSAPQATRGDLAAVIGVRLESFLDAAPQRQAVITDIRTHWAQPWILRVVRAGIMDTQPNYTFQPAAVIRRGDLAQVVARLLALGAADRPALQRAWQSSGQPIADVPPHHLSYPAVAAAVTSGVMSLQPDGTFQLLRPVTGAELVETIGRVEALAR